VRTTDKEEETWKKYLTYIKEMLKYIGKRSNNDNKVELALTALTTVDLYQFMETVLLPKCPGPFQAQVNALKGSLDKVVEFLYSTNSDKGTADQLMQVVALRLRDFIVFLGRCAGLELEIGVFTEEGIPVIEPSQPSTAGAEQAPSTTEPDMRLVGEHDKELTAYYNKLLDYVWQKTNKDKYIPVALVGLETAYLYQALSYVLIFICPKLFARDFYLGFTMDFLKDKVRLLNYAYNPELDSDGKDRTAVDVNDVSYLLWRGMFLIYVARCYGIDIDAELIPKSNGMELAVVRYEPLNMEDFQDFQDSQDFQDFQDSQDTPMN
jgi:hypothetical protein